MNRHGNIIDSIMIISIIFVLACGMMFFTFFIKNTTTSLMSSNTVMSTPTSNAIVTGVDTNTPWVADFFVVMIMFGLPLLAMILAFFNNISPVFFWSTIGFSMLIVVLAGFFENGYLNFVNTSGMKIVESYMPLTAFIMNNFVMYALIVFAVIGFGVYAKTKAQNGIGGLG